MSNLVENVILNLWQYKICMQDFLKHESDKHIKLKNKRHKIIIIIPLNS